MNVAAGGGEAAERGLLPSRTCPYLLLPRPRGHPPAWFRWLHNQSDHFPGDTTDPWNCLLITDPRRWWPALWRIIRNRIVTCGVMPGTLPHPITSRTDLPQGLLYRSLFLSFVAYRLRWTICTRSTALTSPCGCRRLRRTRRATSPSSNSSLAYASSFPTANVYLKYGNYSCD